MRFTCVQDLRRSELSELELLMAVAAGSETQLLCKSSRCLTHLFSLQTLKNKRERERPSQTTPSLLGASAWSAGSLPGLLSVPRDSQDLGLNEDASLDVVVDLGGHVPKAEQILSLLNLGEQRFPWKV